jgi:hypothetical protein
MMQDEDMKRVTTKLDGLAKSHQNKAAVMNHVLDHIQDKKTSRYSLWRMSGFALAAAITGFIVLPNAAVFKDQPQTQVVATPKLSPQMMEDLEMLLVLGEDKVPHGS